MAATFHVLASGSAGNASLLELDRVGVLLDFGLGPRQLARRLGDCGSSWPAIAAVLLTHTHGDHWNALTLGELARRRIALYCHDEHVAALRSVGDAFHELQRAGLVRVYELGTPFEPLPGCTCHGFELSHDSGMTCGFRVAGAGWALAYAADLGSWDPRLARQLADVDVLALEFNHDVALQLHSGRPYRMIRRILGDNGHLSNAQAAALVQAILDVSQPGRLQHLVQLHVSRECNEVHLARDSALAVARSQFRPFEVHTASQATPGPSLSLRASHYAEVERFVQASLPGWEGPAT